MELFEVAVVLLGSSALTAIVTRLLYMRREHVTTAATEVTALRDVATTLASEIDRLTLQVNGLHVLVGALEDEIVFLGGDPIRVRRKIAQAFEGN